MEIITEDWVHEGWGSTVWRCWSTGVKTVNGGLAIHIDGRKL